MRILVAGFGNTLRGDDGFGVEVVRRLAATTPLADDLALLEVGTAGIRLAHELLTPRDVVIVVDAMKRGGTAGDLFVLQVEGVDAVSQVDMHAAIPSQALAIAKALGVLPPVVVLVGCEPQQVDELTCELSDQLSPPVAASVGRAVVRIHHLVKRMRSGELGDAAMNCVTGESMTLVESSQSQAAH